MDKLEELFSSIKQISDLPHLAPFSHLFSSFSTPTPNDSIAIKAAIQESSKHESIIEKTLHQLKDFEMALKARLDVHRKYQSEHQGMLSALRLLPAELLFNIFLMCLPDNSGTFDTFTIDCSPPWSTARVCQKWRSISHSMPLLWVDIPTIEMGRHHQPGFFELLKTVTELSFPHDLILHLRDSSGGLDNIQYVENILPRVQSLDVHHTSIRLINALVERRESFKRLNTAKISFTSESYSGPPRLDFLAEVTSLALCCHWDEEDDPTRYTLLRSVDVQRPNLTTFRGDFLPDFYLRKILFAAPLLQKVTMHNSVDVSFEPTTPPAPTSAVYHTNLKDLRLTSDSEYFDRLSHQVFHRLHLPGLQYLHIEHDEVDHEIIAPVLERTQGSVLKLYIGNILQSSEYQRALSSCPLLEELTLLDATAERLKELTVSSDSRPCPALRRLSLPYFILRNDDEAHILLEFLVSRGLAPFNIPNLPPACHQLESVSVSLLYREAQSIFDRHCFKVDCIIQSIEGYMDIISLGDLHGDLKQRLEKLNKEICSQTLHFLLLLEDFCIIEQTKYVADGKTSHPYDIRDSAKRVYREWTARVEEIRGFPRWKIITPIPEWDPREYVLQGSNSHMYQAN